MIAISSPIPVVEGFNWKSPSFEVTELGIQNFALATGDTNPIHLDEGYAIGTRFKTRVAHGMWAGCLISRVLGTMYPGEGTVYLSQCLDFVRPVRFGDSIRVEVTVNRIDGEDAELTTNVFNQNDAPVVTGKAFVKLPGWLTDV